MAQAGSNYEKTGGRKYHWSVLLKNKQQIYSYICSDLFPVVYESFSEAKKKELNAAPSDLFPVEWWILICSPHRAAILRDSWEFRLILQIHNRDGPKMFLFVFSGKNYFWLGENVKREDAIYLQKSKYHAISFEEILSTISSNSLINFCPKDMLTRTVPLRHSPHSSPPHLMTEYLSFWIFLSKHIHYVTYSAKTTRKSMDTIVYLSRAGIVLGTIPALIA